MKATKFEPWCQLPDFSPQNLTNRRRWLTKASSLDTLATGRIPSVWICDISNPNPQNASNTTQLLANVSALWMACLDTAAQELVEETLLREAQAVANAAWAHSAAGHMREAPTVMAFPETFQSVLQYNAQGPANIAQVHSTLGHTKGTSFSWRVPQIGRDSFDFQVQNLANLTRPSVNIDCLWRSCTGGFATMSLRLTKETNPQAIANMGQYWTRLLSIGLRSMGFLLEQDARGIANFQSQNIANTTWAIATAEYMNKALPGRACFERRCEASGSQYQDASNTAWLHARLGFVREDSTHSIDDEGIQETQSFDPLGLSNLLWRYGKSEPEGPALLNITCCEVSREFVGHSSQNLANRS